MKTSNRLQIVDALGQAADFPIVINGRAASILVHPAEAEVVRIAAGLFAEDVARVAGVRPDVVISSDAAGIAGPVLIIGTVGKSALLGDLASSGKLDPKAIEGQWEAFQVDAIADPFPGVEKALVVAGSDRRGTAFGVFELSKTIGISPWAWWADAPVTRRPTLIVSADHHVQGPPSVKYRGIFLNDEDWGLQPWAAKTFEPECGAIGPKTYAKVCELLLRLKANYLWPAMHECTRAFNSFTENKVVADRYAIVMGSSHCEPMLRNNVSEWHDSPENPWDPATNLPAILEYWEQRVRENGRYENIYTVGMRGIHDSGMPGSGTVEERRDRLEEIIRLQRGMLARHVDPDPARIPQMFCPYKETLEYYRSGMKVPEDVTLIWPNDNFGYIRQLPDEHERDRSGGHGVYYHLSYCGRPHDYLWLGSASPAMVWHEMTKAHALGVRQLWVVNVGDLKAVEAGMTLFLEMAWDIDSYGPDVQARFLEDFAVAQFGVERGPAISGLLDEYFRLCSIRKPEHMGFNRVYFGDKPPHVAAQATEPPRETYEDQEGCSILEHWLDPVKDSGWSHEPGRDEAGHLMSRWMDLARRTEEIGANLDPAAADAYFQLVEYPCCAGAAMAEKIISAEKARRTGADVWMHRSEEALRRIEQLTERYNALNGGKWKGMMDHRPRRLSVFNMPPTAYDPVMASRTPELPVAGSQVIDPAHFSESTERDGIGWRVIEGFGRHGCALGVLPHRDTPTLRIAEDIRARAPFVEYEIAASPSGSVEVTVEALPTHRLTPAHEVVVGLSINDSDPVVVQFDQGEDDENDPTWQRNILRNAMTGTVRLEVPQVPYKLKMWAISPGVAIQKIILGPASDAGNSSS